MLGGLMFYRRVIQLLPVSTYLAFFSFAGCAVLKSLNESVGKSSPQATQEKIKAYFEEGPTRVVYTPFSKGHEPSSPDKIDVLLRKPEEPFKEIAFLNIYRKYSDETAANLLEFVKIKAAEIGAEAVILINAGGEPIGMASSSYASNPTTIGSFGSSTSYVITEESVKTVAIIFKETKKH